jgi:diguanylate cyclase (GGDEF)-like protein
MINVSRINEELKNIIATDLDPNLLLKNASLLLKRSLNLDAILIFYINEEEKRYELVYQYGLTKSRKEKFNNIISTMIDTVSKNERLKLYKKINDSILNLSEQEIKQLDINSVYVYYLIKSDKLVGAIVFCRKKGTFDTSTSHILSSISPTLSLIIENKIYFDKVHTFSNFVNFDGLTGLYNHRYFQESLASELLRAQRFNYNVSLLMIDVDHFKDYNDKYGHPQGDLVLKEITKIIKENIRAYDVASRYGGEEMTVILPYTLQQEALIVAERIRKSVAEHSFPGDTKNEQVKVTVSIGVATFPVNAKTKKDLIDRADQALYLAKSEGRNKVCLSLVVSKELIRVAFCPPAFTSSYYRDILAGVEDVIKEITNIELIVRAPEKESDYDRLKEIFNELIKEKIDAVAICSQSKSIVNEIAQFNKANIPVFLFNVAEKLDGVKVVSYVGYDQKGAGREVGRYLARVLRGKGEIAILHGLPEVTSMQRVAGFKDVVSNYPNMKIVVEEQADWLRSKAQIVTEKILKERKGQLDAIFAVNDEMALGAVEAAKLLGKLKEIFIVGLDGTMDALQSIKEGKLTATLNTNPREMGRILLRTIVRGLIKEEKIDEEIYSPINIVDLENTEQLINV